MSAEKPEKKSMQTKNKVLIALVSLVVIVGIALGVYFGVKSKNDADNRVSNKSQNINGGTSSTTATATTTTTTAAPTPTTAPALTNGTMINGTLFPYYVLDGPAPAPVGVAGKVYTTCTEPNTFSISFDDGPSEWTPELLDLLKAAGLKVTFFINGNNQACIYDAAVQSTLKRAIKDGHQIASHTWSHPDLTTLSVSAIQTEMIRLENSIMEVLGVKPRYMRPPYGAGTFKGDANDKKVQDTMASLGYVITTWDIATGDANIDDNKTPHALSDAVLMEREQKEYTSTVESGVKGAPHMALHHDTYIRTIRMVAPWAIKYVQGLNQNDPSVPKYKIVTVAECVGDKDPRNWYKEIGPPAATTPSTCAK